MLNSEKKVLNETKKHNPPFKLNGRSLNRQFKSAFSEKTSYTTEEFLNSNRMNSTTTQHPNMKYFDITCNGITKLLKQLNPGTTKQSPVESGGLILVYMYIK